MDNNESFLAILIRIIRWITRIVSLLVVLTVLVFFLGEEVFGNDKTSGFNVHALAVIVGILMIGGLLVAWKWEIWGGLISLIGFAGVGWVNPDIWKMPAMYILFGLPALLFIGCGLVQKYYLKEEQDN
jgi:hypothetical protein